MRNTDMHQIGLDKPTSPGSATARSSFFSIGRACVALALLSLLFNVVLPGELEGHWQLWSFFRKSVSKILSSGTAWAALSFYAGWRLRQPVLAVVGGISAAMAALFIHYTVGSALHIYQPGEIETNVIWFLAALVLCGPLGWCGWAATKPSYFGLLARLVLPIGALCEPFVVGKFSPVTISGRSLPWDERCSDAVSGAFLIAAGIILAFDVLRSGPRGSRLVTMARSANASAN